MGHVRDVHGPWTNGSVLTPSKMTVNSTVVDTNGLAITGTLTVTKENGSLLTLS